ncbi:winged helix-turn-helix domain-containing protein [Methanobrevibacter sp. AbM4]|uniref:winged helix-turn-helix domain-containing protein n=1 Tax=Methanobrevibacter sp. AbM4 TaxID=224719 RepID=UPI0006944DB0|nr:winged helix-turn-helix domain-containing protein [Methanobrevibacter sp. AbM4]
MALPKVNDMYLDVLNILSDKKEYKRTKIADMIADQRNFSEKDRNDRLDGGGLRYHNRIGGLAHILKKLPLLKAKEEDMFQLLKKD